MTEDRIIGGEGVKEKKFIITSCKKCPFSSKQGKYLCHMLRTDFGFIASDDPAYIDDEETIRDDCPLPDNDLTQRPSTLGSPKKEKELKS